MTWPQAVRLRTLTTVQNNKSNSLISINCLEYATILINFVAASFCLTPHVLAMDPYPVVRIESDNISSKSWARKGCKDSFGGRALSRINSALMLGNPVGIQIARIATSDNVIADRLSCIPSSSHIPTAFVSLVQEHAALSGCQRFQPNA